MNKLTLSETFGIDVKDDGLPQPWSRIITGTEPDEVLRDGWVGHAEIATKRGAVRADSLRPGDVAMVLCGFGFARIRRAQPHTAELQPIRIRAGALAPDCPESDLLVGPDQAIVFANADGTSVSVDASALVNGATVQVEPLQTLTLWRVELEQHGSGITDVVLVDGVPLATRGGDVIPNASASGFVAARQRVLDRAAALGWEFADDPGLHVTSGAVDILPVLRVGSTYSFELPGAAGGIVHLRSTAGAPIEVEALSSDRRRLGVAVDRISFEGEPIALDDVRLESGFHGVEARDQERWRWTDGDAVLRLDGPGTLSVSLKFVSKSWRRPKPRILAIHHREKANDHYGPFLRWLQVNFPAVRACIDLDVLPVRRDIADYAVVVPWLQDPIQQWSPAAFAEACQLTGLCANRGVPVLNPPADLVLSAKSTTARLLDEIGIRTPRAAEPRPGDRTHGLEDLAGDVLIRENWGHSGLSKRMSAQDPAWRHEVARYLRPVVVEFVDTADRHGLYRKYRYLAAGEIGISVHLLASPHWEVRISNRVISEDLIIEDLDYIGRIDPNHDVLQQARRKLRFDFVAFDYSYDAEGHMVVWEANPFPAMSFGPTDNQLAYRDTAIHRFFAAMAGLYLDRAGLTVPAEIDVLRTYGSPDLGKVLSRLSRV